MTFRCFLLVFAALSAGAGCHGKRDRILTDFFLAAERCSDDKAAARAAMKRIYDEHSNFAAMVDERFEEMNQEQVSKGWPAHKDKLDPCDSIYQDQILNYGSGI